MYSKQKSIDMCNGPLLKKILLFSLPLMLSGILQLIFNATDMVVAGRYIGSNALAAVGANGALINLTVNLFIGLSVGSSVAVAFYYGARDEKSVSQAVHTSIAISIFAGVIIALGGAALTSYLLKLMNTPKEILPLATKYLSIYFLGSPGLMVFNFGSSILRAVGDTRRPLYFLIAAGIINAVLDLILVIVFNMGVAGVAIATIVSQYFSAFMILYNLTKVKGSYRVVIKEIRIYKSKLIRILRIGIPAGIQSLIFSISNVLIQSSINTFGEMAVAGNTASGNLEGFIFVSMDSFYQAAQTFTGQNVGAKKYDRISKVLKSCLFSVTIVGLLMGFGIFIFGKQLLGIYLPGKAREVDFGLVRLSVISTTYFLCGIMNVLSGSIRGMGSSLLPMFVSMVGCCLLRILWVYTIFTFNRSLFVLYLSYPASWIITDIANLISYRVVKKKLIKNTLTELST